ncbi:hypothetical protein [Methanoculleus chikugoensis]|uniref:hypothetical protein n=1 Tax=Methanoculleus chikugoensis TaxID=118126 RepID=UPI001FB355CD|nr:hypothetical protein [Methanoculleus chikugoensis]
MDAPSCRAKATRKMPPVSVTIAWVARPSRMTSFRPCSTSSAVRLFFASKIVRRLRPRFMLTKPVTSIDRPP